MWGKMGYFCLEFYVPQNVILVVAKAPDSGRMCGKSPRCGKVASRGEGWHDDTLAQRENKITLGLVTRLRL